MSKETKTGLVIIAVFVLVAGYIIYQGRPVVQLRNSIEKNNDQVYFDMDSDDNEMEHSDHDHDHDHDHEYTAGEVLPTGTAASGAENHADNTVNLSFRLSQVQSHNSPQDCWAAINGSVYDLTSWVSRHPGGSRAIEQLCGTDGSDTFNKQHGRSKAAQSALVLLKIGALQ